MLYTVYRSRPRGCHSQNGHASTNWTTVCRYHSRPRGLAQSESGMTLAQQISLDYVQPEKWQPKSPVGVPEPARRTVTQSTEPHPFVLDPRINPQVNSEEFLQKLCWGVALTRRTKPRPYTVVLGVKKFPPAFAQNLRLQWGNRHQRLRKRRKRK